MLSGDPARFEAPRPVALPKRLGLLIDTYNRWDRAEPVTEAHYEQLRRDRAAVGEDWPAPSTVAAAYGGWDKACDAALRMSTLGGAARVPADYSHVRATNNYTHLEIADALIRCYKHLGEVWPFEQQYLKWAAQCRHLARAHGQANPRLPGKRQYERLVGDFERALALAARELAARAA